ncbi:MAG TPA: hypothetical protein VNP96_03500 [Solirubrobacterales bacterium]|nr:hypothetical protein [Solirubrobacterales bacterium]
MREQLNSNPLVQLAVVAVLLVGVAVFLMSSGGGGEEEESGTTEATVSAAGTGVSGTATGATPGEAVEGAIDAAAAEAGSATATVPSGLDAPPPPSAVSNAYEADKTVILLFVRNGGIDDQLVTVATAGVAGLRDIALFVVPAGKISRYVAITEGVGVERVPALVVVTPKHLKKSVPTASVSYGFQSPQSVAQAVIDAGYKGPTVDYHP